MEMLWEVFKIVGLIGLGTIAVAYIVIEILYRLRGGDNTYEKRPPQGPRRYY